MDVKNHMVQNYFSNCLWVDLIREAISKYGPATLGLVFRGLFPEHVLPLADSHKREIRTAVARVRNAWVDVLKKGIIFGESNR
jgi:hypothetical protein